MIINLILDDEEEFEKMCGKCKEESKIKKCITCGKKVEVEINPNFDDEYFEKLKKKYGGDS